MATCQTRAMAAQQQAAMAIASKDMTVDDLTRGMLNYKYLGLDFQRADHGRLKYVIAMVFCVHSEGVPLKIFSLFLITILSCFPMFGTDLHSHNWIPKTRIKNIRFAWG